MLVGMKHIRNNLVTGFIATCQNDLNTFVMVLSAMIKHSFEFDTVFFTDL